VGTSRTSASPACRPSPWPSTGSEVVAVDDDGSVAIELARGALVELRQPDVHRIRQVRLLILPPAEHLDHLRVLLGDQALKRLAIHFQPVSAAARQGRCATLFARLAAGNAWRMRRSMEPALNGALVAILLWRRGASRRARQRAR